MKTADLTDLQLDWAVAKCEGISVEIHSVAMINERRLICLSADEAALLPPPKPYLVIPGIGNAQFSTNFAQGCQIIERKGIAVRKHNKTGEWYAMLSSDLGDSEGARWRKEKLGERYGPLSYQIHRVQCRFTGPTLLIAAMRCHVASELGDEIDIPLELL